MLSLLLASACFTTNVPDTSLGDSGDTGPVDSGETGDEAPAIVWSKYKIDTTASLRGVYSSGAGVYVVGTRGRAWVGSATEPWAVLALPTELTGVDLNAVWGAGNGDSLQLAIAADDGLVAMLNAGVWTVTQVTTGDLLGIDGTSAANLYAVGDDGIFHYDGSTWSSEYTAIASINGVFAFDGGAFAVGDEGTVLRKSGESAWTASDTGRAGNMYGVHGSDGSNVWVVGDQGAILHWDGSGWTPITSSLDETLNAVFVAGADAAIVVGDNGAAARWNGSAMSAMGTDTHQNLYAVHGVSGTNAWTVGNGGLAMQFKE
jgi:hypothetical protein